MAFMIKRLETLPQRLKEAWTKCPEGLRDEPYRDGGWTRRTVDSITNPRRGDVLTLSGAAGVSRTGLSTLLSESFVYGYGRYVRYFPIAEQHQLIMRGEVGHVAANDLRYVPIDYRFRAGGAGSVRGYPYQSLGVRAGDSVIGAKSLMILSTEYVHWLTPTWGAAAFVDVGDADNNILKVNLARGYGVGPRWRTLAGLDFPSFILELAVVQALHGRRLGDLANNVSAALEWLRDNMRTAQLVDPANTNNVVTDDLTATERAAIATAAGVARAQPSFSNFVW
jgi:hypothetical protein